MPGGLPSELSPEARGLYSSIGALLSSGMGADRAYRTLRDSGAGIPRATVRSVYGELRQVLGTRADLARLNESSQIPARLAVPTSRFDTNQFVHTVSLILADQVTGFTVQKFYTYYSDELVSPGEAMDAAADIYAEGQSGQGFDVIAMSLVDVQTGR